MVVREQVAVVNTGLGPDPVLFDVPPGRANCRVAATMPPSVIPDEFDGTPSSPIAAIQQNLSARDSSADGVGDVRSGPAATDSRASSRAVPRAPPSTSLSPSDAWPLWFRSLVCAS